MTKALTHFEELRPDLKSLIREALKPGETVLWVGVPYIRSAHQSFASVDFIYRGPRTDLRCVK